MIYFLILIKASIIFWAYRVSMLAKSFSDPIQYGCQAVIKVRPWGMKILTGAAVHKGFLTICCLILIKCSTMLGPCRVSMHANFLSNRIQCGCQAGIKVCPPGEKILTPKPVDKVFPSISPLILIKPSTMFGPYKVQVQVCFITSNMAARIAWKHSTAHISVKRSVHNALQL